MVSTDIGTTGRPVAEGLFTWPAENPRLIGSKSRSGEYSFPAREGEEQVLLNRPGKTVGIYDPAVSSTLAAVRRK